MQLKFKKKVNSGDRENDISLDGPVHLLFPVSGGPVYGTFIGKHTETPEILTEKITLEKCEVEAEGVSRHINTSINSST